MKKNKGFKAIVFALGVISTACGGGIDPAGTGAPGSRPDAVAEGGVGNFTLRDVDGNPHTLSDYLGDNVVVLSFFATWCEPCKMELTDLNNYYRNGPDKGFVVLAIAMDEPETAGDVRLFAKQRRYAFPVLLDAEQEASGLFNPKRTAPFVAVIDKVPSVYWTHAGYLPGDDERLKSVIRAAIEQRQE